MLLFYGQALRVVRCSCPRLCRLDLVASLNSPPVAFYLPLAEAMARTRSNALRSLLALAAVGAAGRAAEQQSSPVIIISTIKC